MGRSLTVSVLLTLAVMFTGCATTGESVRYDSQERVSKAPDAVEIIESGSIAKSHKIIGVVESDEDDLKDALPLMKAEASKMGADAMTEPEIMSRGKAHAATFGAMTVVKHKRKWVSKALVWK